MSQEQQTVTLPKALVDAITIYLAGQKWSDVHHLLRPFQDAAEAAKKQEVTPTPEEPKA